jgi:transposase
MAKRYRPVRRDQGFLLPPDMRDWLPADHPVWLVITVVEGHLDTGAVHALRRAGGRGAAGYDPDMLVTLLVWAYAHRVTSSRRIEALCRTDIAFKVICGGDVPDHVTVARFRAGLGPAAGELFAQVLRLCARLGMGQLGVIALDGMKIAAAASAAANRGEDALRKLAAEVAAAHERTDAAEDELFGPGVRGDEVPAAAADPATRSERIAAALAELEAERRAAAQQQQATASAYLDADPQRRAGRPPGAAAEAAAQARLEQAIAAQHAKIADWQARQDAARAAGHRGVPGPRPAPPGQDPASRRAQGSLRAARGRQGAAQQQPPPRGPVRNITDPASRLMPVRGGGFIQGYNTQNVTSADGLIIATELTTSTTDTACFEPMLAQAQHAAAVITSARPPGASGGSGIGLLLADAGYLSAANLTAPGPDRLIATGKRRDLEKQATGQHAGPARASPHITAMAARLATEEGITAYRQRGHIAETPHARIKHNMGFRQLSVRGKRKASAEWKLACAVHNLFHAITTGHLTTQALAGLDG